LGPLVIHSERDRETGADLLPPSPGKNRGAPGTGSAGRQGRLRRPVAAARSVWGLAHAAAHPNQPMARPVVACRWPATDAGGPPAAALVAILAERSNRGGGAARSTRGSVRHQGWSQLTPQRLNAAWPCAPVARGDGGRRWLRSGDERPQAKGTGGAARGEGDGHMVCLGRRRPEARERGGGSELGHGVHGGRTLRC
jgi:hypothetical protein